MRNSQRGQILLIVVLVMTIALTIGLSIASRTITDVRTGTEQENSQRAFSAAEAGMEKTLQQGTGASGTLTNNNSNATYQTSITSVTGTDFLLNNAVPVLKDEAADLWFSDYPGYTNPWTGDVTIYWGKSTDTCSSDEFANSMAALEIVLVSGTKSAPQLTHYPVDPCSARANVNKFELIPSGGGAVAGKTFAFKKTITVTSGLIMRIIPLYAPTVLGAKGCNGSGGNCKALASQGKIITSVGSSDNAKRKIVGLQENPKIPMQIFPYILFSPK